MTNEEKECLQTLEHNATLDYIYACKTSRVDDWFTAALSARRLIMALGKAGIIKDSFNELYNLNQK